MAETASPSPGGGRANQKKRTRDAIVRAAAELMATGREVAMPEIARSALVSEATAYRYFPDLASLLREAMDDHLPDPAVALAAVTDSADPVERVVAATDYLLRHVLAREGAVRAMIAATIARPGQGVSRPTLRLGLLDAALAPLGDGPAGPPGRPADPDARAAALTRLKLGLSVIVGAEALFWLTDQYGLAPETAIAELVGTATALTRAALSESAPPGSEAR
jgi:AcrR family transcriptional regulator